MSMTREGRKERAEQEGETGTHGRRLLKKSHIPWRESEEERRGRRGGRRWRERNLERRRSKREERRETESPRTLPFPVLLFDSKKKRASEGRKSGLVSRKINYSSAPFPLFQLQTGFPQREREKRERGDEGKEAGR